ncbi:uncharacterized protein LOC117121489 [Anneissia japonica]|uniref:uncharacterized protein LOC117121489 n=1 Tax=Anneissia japonica TaxID=1529436 RepID=UPI0014259445|nr:uncharacterized protein LOC117121489 [Anneissia japonica]
MTNRPKSGRLTNRNLRFLSLSCKERGYTIEERPHGGYKGLSKQYPLSVLAFDKPAEYLKNVRKCVADDYEEEKQRRLNAPAWMSWANKMKNHTGEQALMVQKYLASNKDEQVKGVLSSYTERMQNRCNSAPSDPDKMLVKTNSTHQFLTSTDRYGESAELVDISLGRPTRASLLRVHHRSQSAPQVRAPLENKTFLHRQQKMAMKKEDKYKTADVPKDLQPITHNGETIYEFLVGARYNRSYCADATSMSKLGLYVSRDEPLRCFLHRPFQVPQGASKDVNYQSPQSSLASNSLPQSTERIFQHDDAKSLSLHVKSAWEKNDPVTALSRPTTALMPTSHINQDNFGGAVTTSSYGSKKMEKEVKSDEHKEPYCVMCHGGVPKHAVASKKQNTVRNKDEQECADHLNQDDHWKKSYVNILEQNYHLNITGTRVGFHSTKPSAPRSSHLHYSMSSTLYRQNKKTVRPHNNMNNNHPSRPASTHNGSITGRSDSESSSDRSGSSIHVAIPAMPTSGEVDMPKEVITNSAQGTRGNHLKENCAVVSEDQKEVDCGCRWKEFANQNGASTHSVPTNDEGTLGISTSDSGKSIGVDPKEDQKDAIVKGGKAQISVPGTKDSRGMQDPSTDDSNTNQKVAEQTECEQQTEDVSEKDKEPEEALPDYQPQEDGDQHDS